MIRWKKNTILTFISFCLPYLITAQSYKEGGKTRYRFAQTAIGLEYKFSPSTGRSFLFSEDNSLRAYAFNEKVSPVLMLAGTHFWGHAIFFTGITLTNHKLGERTEDYNFRRTGGTGFKIFPLPIEYGKLRPYVGSAISGFSFRQENAAELIRREYPLLFGLTYASELGLFELGAHYYIRNKYHYYTSPAQQIEVKIPDLTISLKYKYLFDFTLMSEVNDRIGKTKRNFDKLKENKKLNSYSLAVGVTNAYFLGSSSYNSGHKPYLDDYKITKIYPDITVGYYHFNSNLQGNIAFRSYRTGLEAFDEKQQISRTNISLELYKFAGDYHGFTPFFGLTANAEFLSAEHRIKNETKFKSERRLIRPGFIAGWDIRPTKIDWWVMRTNIRFNPFLQIEAPEQSSINLNQLELTFLQLVVYPNRLMALNK
ncbi:MAG: hypothetical protein ACK40G_03275 [Cytophagaceae bacterium]